MDDSKTSKNKGSKASRKNGKGDKPVPAEGHGPTGGYCTELFICPEADHELFHCTACSFVIRDFREVSCGHAFCSSCLLLAFERSDDGESTTCPECRSSVERNQVKHSAFADRIIGKLAVCCPRKDHGCDWKGAVSTLHQHAGTCGVRLVPCEYAQLGCDFQGPIATLQAHAEENVGQHLALAAPHLQKLVENEQKMEEMEESLEVANYELEVTKESLHGLEMRISEEEKKEEEIERLKVKLEQQLGFPFKMDMNHIAVHPNNSQVFIQYNCKTSRSTSFGEAPQAADVYSFAIFSTVDGRHIKSIHPPSPDWRMYSNVCILPESKELFCVHNVSNTSSLDVYTLDGAFKESIRVPLGVTNVLKMWAAGSHLVLQVTKPVPNNPQMCPMPVLTLDPLTRTFTELPGYDKKKHDLVGQFHFFHCEASGLWSMNNDNTNLYYLIHTEIPSGKCTPRLFSRERFSSFIPPFFVCVDQDIIDVRTGKTVDNMKALPAGLLEPQPNANAFQDVMRVLHFDGEEGKMWVCSKTNLLYRFQIQW